MFRIANIDALTIAIPLRAPAKLAGVTIATCDNLIVRIVDGDGRVGWGEAASAPTMTGETPEGMAAAARFMAHKLHGVEITDARALPELIEPLIYRNNGAKSAIDMALLDLVGQHCKQPLYEVLGGRRRDRAAMIWQLSGATDEAEDARRLIGEGAVAFKVKVGTHGPATDLERSRAVRNAVGSGPRVSADANEGYDRANALVFARGAGEAGLDYFEQPVAGQDLEGMRACADAASIPISADEGLRGLAAIERHHEAGAAKGGSLKPIKLGGAFQVMTAARLMDNLGMHVNLAGKTADSSIGSAGIAHLATALPQIDWDVNITNHLLIDDVVRTPLSVVAGHVMAPDGPGLGIMVDEDKLARFRTD